MRRLAVALALAVLCGCAGRGEYFRDAGAPPRAAARALADWPWREIWTGVVFRGQKVGFSRLAISPAADAPGFWDLETESALRLRFLGIDKRVSLRARDRVDARLQLREFRYEYFLDGSRLSVEGEAVGSALAVRVTSGGRRTETRIEAPDGALPASALALLPALRGLGVGASVRVSVFIGESQSLAPAVLHAAGYERSTLFEGAALRVTTSLLGLETQTWIDADGRPVLEQAMHGAMISALEDPARARAYLVEASLAKQESLLEFSLLRAPDVPDARRVAAMEIALEGVPDALGAPGPSGQRCARHGERLACRVDRREAGPGAAPGEPAAFLRPSLAVPSNERQFLALARDLGLSAEDPAGSIDRVLAWMDANIAKEAVDAFSADDVLRERRGECQGHAYLLAALLRAAGVATRVVNGIVYVPEHGGFLYHTWNEVWIAAEGWRPVDAIFGQSRADATHLALAVGESPAAVAPLAAMVGRARVADLSVVARW